jgi:hypothetical protein
LPVTTTNPIRVINNIQVKSAPYNQAQWTYYNPAFAMFMLGTTILIMGVLVFAVYMATHNIIP